MSNLLSKKCVPHEKIVALNEEEIKDYLPQVNHWGLLDANKIQKLFKFEDFVKAIEFVNKVAAVAEEEGHHPDIEIHYNKVTIVLWSHFVKGLSQNDFIMAANIDLI